ncbi:hypothetical protein ACLBX9_26340 [Methylobacterium sp. A49B]
MLHAYKWWNQINACQDLADAINSVSLRIPDDHELLSTLRDELTRIVPVRFVRMLSECSDDELCAITQIPEPGRVTQEIRNAARRRLELDRSRDRQLFEFMLNFQREYFMRKEERFARCRGR